mmetsp:Transcript_86304/g.171342  ORF Transcript_86304/g.171342 Transcript_86304/m.171342 type:complete len:383 (+) Transcript_86304:76-1224(+)
MAGLFVLPASADAFVSPAAEPRRHHDFRRGSAAQPFTSSEAVLSRISLGAALQVMGATAGACLAVAGLRRTRRSAQNLAKPRLLVQRCDGSSWGSNRSDASTSVDTSGPLPIVKLSFGGTDEAIVNLFGGCVTSYKHCGVEWLAVRPDAKLDGSKPISGGLPHCFPQFGPGVIQQHGFARNLMWKLLEEPSEDGVCVMELTDNEETRKMWPFSFRAEYRVELLEDRLKTTLLIENPVKATSVEPCGKEFFFTAALHSYYGVGNVGACKIVGKLMGSEKLDKTEDPPKMSKATSDTIQISKFTEEIYKDVLPGQVALQDPSKGELEIISSGGWKDVVVWNPYGDDKMGADGFVCVESAALEPVTLIPGACWDATLELVPKQKQ